MASPDAFASLDGKLLIWERASHPKYVGMYHSWEKMGILLQKVQPLGLKPGAQSIEAKCHFNIPKP